MIRGLASPSVCVIDDEEADYAPILNALMGLGLGCVHVRGRHGDPLPPEPFSSLRIVFTDLHLSGQVGKQAASHTANVVRKVVSAGHGPVVLVIWSKYADDLAGDQPPPASHDQTEAELFKSLLLEAEPAFTSRLIFREMKKPKPHERAEQAEWIAELRTQVEAVLASLSATRVIWTWESMARNVGFNISEMLVSLAGSTTAENGTTDDKLKLIMRLLAHQQGGPDLTAATAPRHLLTVLSQAGQNSLLSDPLIGELGPHAEWLAEKVDEIAKKGVHCESLNARLLTAPVSPSIAIYAPGVLYEVTDTTAFPALAGFTIEQLQRDCFEGNPDKSPDFGGFKERTRPIMVEVSPACDYYQGTKRLAALLAGLEFPPDLLKKVRSKDSCKVTPIFENRFKATPGNVGFVFCGRYRFTIPLSAGTGVLKPHLQVREMLLADIRTWASDHAARIGYLSF